MFLELRPADVGHIACVLAQDSLLHTTRGTDAICEFGRAIEPESTTSTGARYLAAASRQVKKDSRLEAKHDTKAMTWRCCTQPEKPDNATKKHAPAHQPIHGMVPIPGVAGYGST